MSGRFEVDPPEDDMETLAAEYVLGLLTVAQRPHVDALRHGGMRFDQAVRRWESQLLPFAQAVEPVAPPDHLWRVIAATIAPQPARSGIWSNVSFWRNFGFLTGITSAGLAAALVAVTLTRAPQMPLATATLASVHEGAFVATASRISGGVQLVVSPSQVSVPAGESAELWLILPGRKPAPLGLLAARRPVMMRVPEPQLVADIGLAELAVSIEPTGGSRTGQPTGPIISAARFSPV